MITNIRHALRIQIEFISWIFRKIGQNILDAHLRFARQLYRETPFTIFVWFAISLLFSLLMSAAAGLYAGDGAVATLTFFTSIKISIAYLIFTGITIAFKAFLQEREHVMAELRRTYDQ